MGYLICVNCGGYYELQEGEKPEDFINECECGGKLIYSESLEILEESESLDHIRNSDNLDITGEIGEEETSPEDELPLRQSKTLENYKATLEYKSRMKKIRLATDVHEILETKGHYIIRGNDNAKAVKLFVDGIETDNGQFIKFDDVITIEDNEGVTPKQKVSEAPSTIGALVETGYEIFAPKKVNIKIIFDKGEIELDGVNRSDAKKLVSFLNWELSRGKIDVY